MNNWLYYYIEYTVKYGQPFYKECGWALNHKSNYIILSTIKS